VVRFFDEVMAEIWPNSVDDSNRRANWSGAGVWQRLTVVARGGADKCRPGVKGEYFLLDKLRRVYLRVKKLSSEVFEGFFFLLCPV
jgi:hypothetical protein